MWPRRCYLNGPKWIFGEFELDAAGFQLRRQTRPVKIERIPLELLILLVERPGQLVGREEIASILWGNDVHVDIDSGINTAIRKLRAALRDSADKPALIETVPGKGYRFIAPVSIADPPPEHAAMGERSKWPRRAATLAAAFAVVMAASLLIGFRPTSDAPTDASSATIAVLPFENLSGDPEHDFFSDGLTEETIAALGEGMPSRIRVIARTSVMAYKGSGKPARQIGAELKANYIVESSVRRDPSRFRITSRLIRAADEVQTWTASYDRAPADALGIQDEIGRAIAKEIGVEIAAGSGPGQLTERRATQDPDAYDLYLRGRYYLYQRTPDSLSRSLEQFEAALRKDPSYSLAYAGIAETYIIQTPVSGANPVEQRRIAREAVDKALELEPNLVEAHTAAGLLSFFMEWDWQAAERSFRRAIETNPSSAAAHQFYGHLLSNWLRHDEAIAEIQKAREIDPLSPMMHAFAAGSLSMARRYQEALPPVEQALAIDPEFFPAHTILGHVYQQTGNFDGAIAEFRKARQLSGGNLMQLAYEGNALAQSGRRAEAEQILGAMNQISQSRFVPPSAFAIVYAGLGDRNAAFAWLEKAYEARDAMLVFLPGHPYWDSLRSDDRFKDLLRRCGFPV